ncbi:MAG: DNA primase, partial [Hyphomicrobiales bacterium]|nr:DNA primase [Hyphomicrobiales bacterium]
MKFLPTFLDEIRARIPVSEIVGEKVRLKKQGREWAGLSPFNAERTPSFFVNDQKGFYHDFSSGRHGDVFRFLMETEGLSFPEAVERLASRAGLEMPRFEPADAEREKARAGLHETLAHAQAWFEAQLKGRAGEAARAYLDRRGLSEPIRREFGIGFAPDARFALRDHLAAKGASAQTMIDAGLLIHGEGIAVPYDRFRDRVTFPIADRAGKVIAFGGRAMSAEAKAKYLNSPETELFHKGAGLYNFHR